MILSNATGRALMSYRVDKDIGLISTQTFLHEFVHLLIALYLVEPQNIRYPINETCSDSQSCIETQKRRDQDSI